MKLREKPGQEEKAQPAKPEQAGKPEQREKPWQEEKAQPAKPEQEEMPL